MLPPSAYHRFHLPVAGRLLESFVTHGQVYMQVDLQDGRLASLDRADTGYEFFQTRGVVVVDTANSPEGDLGLVGIVPVGMSHVASVVLTGRPGVELAKGDEFGYFQFGGSDIVLLFQRGVELDLDTSDGFRHVGSRAATRHRTLSGHAAGTAGPRGQVGRGPAQFGEVGARSSSVAVIDTDRAPPVVDDDRDAAVREAAWARSRRGSCRR